MAQTALHEEEYQGQLNLRLWGRVLLRGRRYWRLMAGLAAAATLTAGIDTSFTLVTRAVINDVEAHGASAGLWGYATLYVAMVCAFASCIWLFIRLGGRISTGISHDIRQAGFERLQELSFSYYDRRPVGWLMTRLTSDCDRLSRILSWGLLDIAWGALLLVGVSIVMLVVNWKLALLVLSVVPVLVWASLVFQKRILATSRQVRKTNSNITASYNEAISGVRTTKALVRERENLTDFERLTDQMYGHSVRNAIWSAVYLPIVIALGTAGGALALWKGGADVIGKRIALGDLYLFLAYSGYFFIPVQELARVFTDLQNAQAAAERIVGLLETRPEIADSPEVAAAIERHRAAEPREGAAIDGLPGRIESIEFRDVSFRYHDGEKVLEDFCLRVEAGQTIALVGPTGGGKTTIVGLLCRFYEPTGGQVLVNGIDYRRRSLLWLQSNLGIVLQTPHLFSGTVRENIRYGRLNARDDEIEWAAGLAGAHEFITRLEAGYDTQVGQGGNKLSVGQKQLVSLARAVLADPQIFIMDEATSSVDTETEQLIQEGIAAILGGRTSFVIAHRLSTIRSADRILLIEGGRIVEDGTHRRLIALRGRYYDLYTNQFARQREEEVVDGFHG